jgi:hypothetical protein
MDALQVPYGEVDGILLECVILLRIPRYFLYEKNSKGLYGTSKD